MTRPSRRTGLVFLVFAALVASLRLASGQSADAPILVLISIDGWRWDYLEKFRPPALARMASAGVRAEGLIPTFPSKTFPNHYTIVTGLYPSRHGIISNTMSDPALPYRFTLADRWVQQDTRWWGGEPIWVTSERQGQIAATMFWPGSDAEIAGDRPTYYEPFDGSLANHARVDKLLEWMRVPEPNRPTFLTLYFSDVDTAGHDYGPETEELRRAALDVDGAIARLVSGVEAAGLVEPHELRTAQRPRHGRAVAEPHHRARRLRGRLDGRFRGHHARSSAPIRAQDPPSRSTAR